MKRSGVENYSSTGVLAAASARAADAGTLANGSPTDVDRADRLTLGKAIVFVLLYVALDWVSFRQVQFGLDITPWDPEPPLGLAVWLRYGPAAAMPWYVALVSAELLVRGNPLGLAYTLEIMAVVLLGYGVTGELMRGFMPASRMVWDRTRLMKWGVLVVFGMLFTSVLQMTVIYSVSSVLSTGWANAVTAHTLGDVVGVCVNMPFMMYFLDWRPRSMPDRRHVRELVLYTAFAVGMLAFVFAFGTSRADRYFYMLFPPLIWAAFRHGMRGAAAMAVGLQIGIVVVAQWQGLTPTAVFELQELFAVLVFVGYSVGVVVDEERATARTLEESARLAAVGEMAAALAHELNQPMTALIAYGAAGEKILESGEPDPAVVAGVVRGMVRETRRSSDVVQRLRDFFRTGETRLEKIELEPFVKSLAESFATQSGTSVQVEVATAAPQPTFVLADRVHLALVLRNLLANASDAVSLRPDADRLINIDVGKTFGGMITIGVTDNGPGIAPAMLPKLFQSFQSNKPKGLGLGLVISRALIEAHGGVLWVEPGARGVFRFSLPVVTDTKEDNAA